MEKTKEFLGLTVEQVQAIGNYLVNRPYGEVDKLIDILKNAPKLNVTFPEPPGPVEAPVSIGEDTAKEAVKTAE